MVAKTLYGLEDVLAEELSALQAEGVEAGRRMVSFRGDRALMYRANMHCRTALRILKSLARFKAAGAGDVYEGVKKIEWERYFSPEKTFAVDAVIYSESFNHSKFVAYRTKDAIADYFDEKFGKRPSVRINRPDMYIHVHISHQDCTVALDSSGESLHKRGYRTAQGEAPINETLAAGMILKTGWRGESNFVDPMCGSGTLLIEAAMIALNIPPGLYRKEYAFEKWPDFDADLFDEIYNDDSGERDFTFKCFGSDVSPAAIELARENVRNAGLMKYVELKTLPFQQYTQAPETGILVTNPPYGERMAPTDIENLYRMIGERLKHAFTGYRAWVLSYREACFEYIGLHPCRKIKLMNGSLDCEFRCYELFAGTNKDYKTALNGEERKPYSRRPAEEEKPADGSRRTFAKDRPFARDNGKPFVRDNSKPFAKDRPFVRDNGKPFVRDNSKPFAKDRSFVRDNGKPFDRDNSKPFAKDRSFARDNGKPFVRDNSKPFAKDRPFARDNGKPFVRDNSKPFAKDRPFIREKGKPFDRDNSKPFAKDRPFVRDNGKPFVRDNSKPFAKDRPFVREKGKPFAGDNSKPFAKDRPFVRDKGKPFAGDNSKPFAKNRPFVRLHPKDRPPSGKTR
ncbi:MAG: THUMP domain-containing protein [Tannerella sp.]|nr:THUMP domain-containing protein [Tannerella sp.]